jgi:hypothetical protein
VTITSVVDEQAVIAQPQAGGEAVLLRRHALRWCSKISRNRVRHAASCNRSDRAEILDDVVAEVNSLTFREMLAEGRVAS